MNARQLSPQTLAHELNSLLDGALRWLSLAGREARALSDEFAQARETILHRQEAAEQALRQMAEVLARAQSQGRLAIDALLSPRTIGQELQHMLSLLEPQATQFGVEVVHELDPGAAALPAGVLGPILVNGMRNAIESCSQPGLATRRVTVSIVLRSPHALQVLIEDTGAGLPQTFAIGRTVTDDGHGLGLPLCRSLVEQVGGSLELANVPYGGGAVLSVTVDPTRLTSSGAHAA